MDKFITMTCRIVLLAFAALVSLVKLQGQSGDSLRQISAFIYDSEFKPVPATHVVNIQTRQGDVSDNMGVFHLPVRSSDSLLILNIAFRDTLVPVSSILEKRYIVLRRKAYPLLGAKVFEWGSTYEDFRSAIIEMPVQQTLGASMGLPTQDPDKVPVEMDEQAVKSAGLLLTSPITYFYQNFSRHAKSARKVYWLKKNRLKHEAFEEIVNGESLSGITGLSGKELLDFQSFLLERMVCDFKCEELAIYKEIYGLWEVYQELGERGMLEGQGPRRI